MNKKNFRNVRHIIALVFMIIICLFISLKIMIFPFIPNAAAAYSSTDNWIIQDFVSTNKSINYALLSVREHELLEISSCISDCTSRLDALAIDIENLHQDCIQAKTCSKANRFFNNLDELYNEFLALLDQTQLYNHSYEESYIQLVSDVKHFNARIDSDTDNYILSSVNPLEMQAVFNGLSYAQMQIHLGLLYIESKEFADAFYKKDYFWACAAAQNEAGYSHWPPEEQYWVLGVAENRAEHENYPDTLEGVFSDPGQYTWYARGCKNIPITEQTAQNVENFLRGRVDTGMPSTVIYQSKEQLGEEWYYSPISGHHFCSPYGS